MNLTNVFIDILRSAMTQTSCDMIEGLSTQDWEKIYFKIVIQGFSSSGREIRSIRQEIRQEKVFCF